MSFMKMLIVGEKITTRKNLFLAVSLMVLMGALGFILGVLSAKTSNRAMAGAVGTDGEANPAEAAPPAALQGAGCQMRLGITKIVPTRRPDGGVDIQVDWLVRNIGDTACPTNYIKSIEYKLKVTPLFGVNQGESKSFDPPGNCPSDLRRGGSCSAKVTLPSPGRPVTTIRAELRATATGLITGGDVSQVPLR